MWVLVCHGHGTTASTWLCPVVASAATNQWHSNTPGRHPGGTGSRHGAAVLRETNALDEVVRPFATSVEVAAAALVARVKRSN